MCERWKDLKDVEKNFEAKWLEYQKYKKLIPSFGAVIFSKRSKKMLFSRH